MRRHCEERGYATRQSLEPTDRATDGAAAWIEEGKLNYREDILDGLENTPKAFMRMLKGENKGKQLVKVS